jgi:hypothetical protein
VTNNRCVIVLGCRINCESGKRVVDRLFVIHRTEMV